MMLSDEVMELNKSIEDELNNFEQLIQLEAYHLLFSFHFPLNAQRLSHECNKKSTYLLNYSIKFYNQKSTPKSAIVLHLNIMIQLEVRCYR